MNAKTVKDRPEVIVTLSKRNLLTLLQKVDLPTAESRCMIQRRCDNGWLITVCCEPDAVHYGEREPGQVRADAARFTKEAD